MRSSFQVTLYPYSPPSRAKLRPLNIDIECWRAYGTGALQILARETRVDSHETVNMNQMSLERIAEKYS